MQTHLNLIIISLSLIVIVISAVAMVVQRRANHNPFHTEITDDHDDCSIEENSAADDILSIPKKVEIEPEGVINYYEVKDNDPDEVLSTTTQEQINSTNTPAIVVVNLMANPDSPFVGNELLQTLFSLGFRFGEMNIFHYYQTTDNHEKLAFSLASITEPGAFNMDNMNDFSTSGLTLFFQPTGDVVFDLNCYDQMLITAHHISEKLGGNLFDEEHLRITASSAKQKKMLLGAGDLVTS